MGAARAGCGGAPDMLEFTGAAFETIARLVNGGIAGLVMLAVGWAVTVCRRGYPRAFI